MRTLVACLIVTTAWGMALHAQPSDPLLHTYSIVARDATTGEMAVGVQSHWFAVGNLCPWVEAGVGAVATQSFVDVTYGPKGLALMREGKTAPEALAILLDADEGRDYRQVAMVDARGNVAAHTGAKCIAYAGHYTGDGFSVQANMMLKSTVWEAMASSFEKNKHLSLAERVLAAMEAAEAVGGDIRGKQSAALLLTGPTLVANAWENKKIDLRVDDHPLPLKELARLLKVQRAYDHMNAGDLAMEHADMALAFDHYNAASELFPDNLEMKFWQAIARLQSNDVETGLKQLKDIYKKDPNWYELTLRLAPVGLLPVEASVLDRIKAMKVKTSK
jgi:uncharacterized Ntn-hydrolase superfamily protein